MKVVTAEEMRQIEAASDAAGHSYAAMMEQAGRSVAKAIATYHVTTQPMGENGKLGGARRGFAAPRTPQLAIPPAHAEQLPYHELKEQRILVLVGPGNNGGDGLVAARYLAEAGATVTCYLLRPRDADTDPNYGLVQEREIEIVLAEEDEQYRRLWQLALDADVIVDALLGTGARLPLRGALAEMLGQVQKSFAEHPLPSARLTTPSNPSPPLPEKNKPFIVAVDGPTGLDYDSGELDPAACPADLTVTFAYPKVGHFRFPGAGALGELVVADIGTPPALAKDIVIEIVTPAMVQSWLPARPPDAHKGSFGKALIVAGSINYTGAAYLAGAAATRAGAGLVTLALPTTIHGAVASRLAEATYLPLPDEKGFITAGAAQVLGEQFASYDALLLGPGLGQTQETRAFVEALLRDTKEDKSRPRTLPPLVIDADGLNILAKMARWPTWLPPGSILTPHPGEMARLMGCTTVGVQADRIAAARSQAAAWGQIVVLKGAHTIIAAPDGRVVIEPFANSGLATAGTGDVLAGTIAALRAQGMAAFEAAASGAYLHGTAGELAREKTGTAGMVAGDVLAHLARAQQRIAGT